MSLMTYNGVSLPYPMTTSFKQNVKRDESDTDRVYTEFDITVQCVMTSAYLSLLAPSLIVNGLPVTGTAADIMKAVRQLLMRDRRQLTFTFNGVNLLPGPQGEDIAPIRGTVDAANGPKPQFCEVTQLTNTTFLVLYRIVARYWENNIVSPNDTQINKNSIGNDILYNRWTETVDIDNALYTTKTRDGTFRIRSDNTGGFIADQLRLGMAQLAIPQGFVRQSAHYQQTPDGLNLNYRLIDKEVYLTPPVGAYEADGEFIENSTQNMGYHTAECWVTLRGSKATSFEALLLTALAIVNSKMRMPFARFRLETDSAVNLEEAAVRAFITNVQVRVKLYDKEVTVRSAGIYTPPNNIKGEKVTKLNFAHFDTKAMVATPAHPLDPLQNTPPPFPNRGTAPILLRAAAYWDASLAGGGMAPGGVNMAQGLTPGQAGLIPEA